MGVIISGFRQVLGLGVLGWVLGIEVARLRLRVLGPLGIDFLQWRSCPKKAI